VCVENTLIKCRQKFPTTSAKLKVHVWLPASPSFSSSGNACGLASAERQRRLPQLLFQRGSKRFGKSACSKLHFDLVGKAIWAKCESSLVHIVKRYCIVLEAFMHISLQHVTIFAMFEVQSVNDGVYQRFDPSSFSVVFECCCRYRSRSSARVISQLLNLFTWERL